MSDSNLPTMIARTTNSNSLLIEDEKKEKKQIKNKNSIRMMVWKYHEWRVENQFILHSFSNIYLPNGVEETINKRIESIPKCQ